MLESIEADPAEDVHQPAMNALEVSIDENMCWAVVSIASLCDQYLWEEDEDTVLPIVV